MEREREIARAIMSEILEQENMGEKAKKWIIDHAERYMWNQYLYRKRKEEYLQYMQNMLYSHAILQKIEFLKSDLLRTRKKLIEKAKRGKKIKIKENSRQEAALAVGNFDFVELRDEIATGQSIFAALYDQEIEVSIQKQLL